STQGSVVSWAESFETLLQDRVAVTYFTEFLKKEFSAENVYFWQACERFQQIPASDTQQLAQEARRIYDEFLSSHSVSPVNIDKQAWIGEDMLATPSPDMFRIQQLQIFNLMKFDSYTRFVKSPLYQACLRAESQGQPLPDLRPHSRSSSPPPDLSKKTKLKLGKSLPLGVETAGSSASRSLQRSFRKGERREPSWAGGSTCRIPQQQITVVYILFLKPLSFSGGKILKKGFFIKDVCDRELWGCTVPQTQSPRQSRVPWLCSCPQPPLVPLYSLEISSLNKTVRITAKSTKRIREALQPVLGKYGVSVEQALLRRQGEPATLDLEKLVGTVSAQKLVLETPADVRVMGSAEAAAAPSLLRSEEGSPTGAEPDTRWERPSSFSRPQSSAAMNLNRRTYDLEGLVELLNRAQSCRANDQRGLLSKEDLVLPDFLQLPVQDSSACEGSQQPSAPQAGSEGSSCPQEEPALAQPSLDHK
ncbi:RGS14 protein, partial [Emberiza fucata]|nr:RGS14 protein [Emberiza fucata]